MELPADALSQWGEAPKLLETPLKCCERWKEIGRIGDNMEGWEAGVVMMISKASPEGRPSKV